jgi:hypothetical protein
MRRKGRIVGGVIVLSIALLPVTVFAFGIGVDLPVYTLDLSASLAKVPVAVADSLDALGISGTDAASIRADMNTALAQIEADFPVSSMPIPLLGGSIECRLPFIVIDGLRLSGGIMNDSLLRAAADLFDMEVPNALFDETIDIDGIEGTVRVDLSFSTFMLTSEVVKRFDLAVAGFDLGLGVDLIQGWINPEVEIVSSGFQTEIDEALSALHLNDLRWSVFAAHVSLGVKVGPPFLRVFARGALLLPLSQSTGWWPTTVGSISGNIGMVIRF